MTLGDYVKILRRGWVPIAACLAVGGVLGLAITLMTPATYLSSTTLYVTSQSDNTTQAYQGGLLSEQRVQSYTQLLASTRVSGDVVRRLGLPESPGTVASWMSASAQPDSVVLVLSVRAASPELATQVANTAADSFTGLVAELERPVGREGPPAVAARVVEPAIASDIAVSPLPALNIGLGIVSGLVIGILLTVVRNALDTSVRSSEDLQEVADAAVLGIIPDDPQCASEPLSVRSRPGSLHSEACRQVRTNLNFVRIDLSRKVLLVTSSLPGEGKTTTACNLAMSIGEAGFKVLLVEADLRRPKAGDYLGLTSSVGLTNILAGSGGLRDVVQKVGGSSVDFLGSGRLPPNPSELLASSRMRELIGDTRNQYDYVLVDAPPILPVADASGLAPSCDGVVLLCRYGSTARAAVRASVESVSAVGSAVVGIILSRAPKRAGGYGGYTGYGSYAAVEPAKGADDVSIGAATESPAPVRHRPSPRRRAGVDAVDTDVFDGRWQGAGDPNRG